MQKAPFERHAGARLVCTTTLSVGFPILISFGCRSSGSLPPELERRIAAETVTLSSVRDDDLVRASAESIVRGELAPPAAVPLPDDASAETYVALALERNPGIRARIRELEALGLRFPQETSWSDPMLQLGFPLGDGVQTAGGEVQGTLGLSQGLPWPSKLRARGEIAEQVVRVALENLRAERLSVEAEVRQAFYSLYLADASIRVTSEDLELLQRLRSVAQAKYAAGTAPQQDLLRAEVELYSASNELITLEQERQTSAARLNALMDRDIRAEIPAPAEPSPRGIGARIETLEERAFEASPELAALRAQARAGLASIRLAELRYYPDVQLGGLWTFIAGSGLSPLASGKDVFGVSLGAALPIWRERLRAAVLEQNARLLATAERYRERRNETFLALQQLFVRTDAAYRSAVLLRDAILPRARQALTVSESGYQAGEVDFTTLIENWQRLLELTLSYHAALARLEQEVAGLEQVLGERVARTDETDETDDPQVQR